jgi:hypothetical protein
LRRLSIAHGRCRSWHVLSDRRRRPIDALSAPLVSRKNAACMDESGSDAVYSRNQTNSCGRTLSAHLHK